MNKIIATCALIVMTAFVSGNASANCYNGKSVKSRIQAIYFNPWEGFPYLVMDDPEKKKDNVWVSLDPDYFVDTPQGRAMLSIALAAYANNSIVELSCKRNAQANKITIWQK
ncbi:hypothetical protein [Luteimonas panaciterrae]|uniref:hypothetical protein n=1 Tax=Luteimonas panaciterrae TaxID=363885 RepID=UPI001CF9CF79|nr:hypothetical protein [Luteimonas panaciterrae]